MGDDDDGRGHAGFGARDPVFLSHLSHELRAPLTAVLGLSEILAEGVYGPVTARQRDALRTIRRNGKQLFDLISDVIALSRLGAHDLTLRFVELQVEPLLLECVEASAEATAVKGQRVETELAPELPNLYTDARQLTRIVGALLVNASRRAPPGGLLCVGARHVVQSDCVELWVADAGPAVVPADLSRIFDPFVMLEPTDSVESGGAGLGLTLAKRLTERLGGRVGVQLEDAGGLRIVVSVPVRAGASSVVAPT